MPKWLPSVPYPPRKQGYWEPVTSTLNWCEEDYYATIYSAEIVNTTTNLLFQYLAWRGIFNCIQNGHDRIFLVSFIGFFLVGTGSFLFHATLKYPMQLVDELSMIYTTCVMLFATFSHNKKAPIPLILAVFLVSLAIFITGYYHYLQDPAFHQTMYGLLTAIVVFRAIHIMEINIRPALRKQGGIFPQEGIIDARAQLSEGEQKRMETRDKQILNDMWIMIATGMSIFFGAFGLWTIDQVYCNTLRRWRHELGLPWGLLLEGHGWWHLLTGVGAYFWVLWGIWLRHCLNGRQDEFELIWKNKLTSLPAIVKKKPEAQNNGVTKKMR